MTGQNLKLVSIFTNSANLSMRVKKYPKGETLIRNLLNKVFKLDEKIITISN